MCRHQHCAYIDARVTQAENATHRGRRIIQQLRPARAVSFIHNMAADRPKGRCQQVGDGINATAQILVGLFWASDRQLCSF